MLAKHVFAGTDIARNPSLIGTGPFRTPEYEPGEYYRVTRNDTSGHAGRVRW